MNSTAQKTIPYMMALTTLIAAEGCSNATFTIKTPESSTSRVAESKDAQQIKYARGVLHLRDNDVMKNIGGYMTSLEGDMKLRIIAGLYAGTMDTKTGSNEHGFKSYTAGTFDGRKNMTELERAAMTADTNHDKIVTPWEAETLLRKLQAEKSKTKYQTQNNAYQDSKARTGGNHR